MAKLMKMLKRPAVLGAIVVVLILAFVLYGSYEGFQSAGRGSNIRIELDKVVEPRPDIWGGSPAHAIPIEKDKVPEPRPDIWGGSPAHAIPIERYPSPAVPEPRPIVCPMSIINWNPQQIIVPKYAVNLFSFHPTFRTPRSTELAFPSSDGNGKLIVTYSPAPTPNPCGDSQNNGGHLNAIKTAFESAMLKLGPSSPPYSWHAMLDFYKRNINSPPGYHLVESWELKLMIDRYVSPSMANLNASLKTKA